jgi:hypothetical protein
MAWRRMTVGSMSILPAQPIVAPDIHQDDCRVAGVLPQSDRRPMLVECSAAGFHNVLPQ